MEEKKNLTNKIFAYQFAVTLWLPASHNPMRFFLPLVIIILLDMGRGSQGNLHLAFLSACNCVFFFFEKEENFSLLCSVHCLFAIN